jgi:protein-tyrosine phosphatase
VIDLHFHVLPGLDDGPSTLERTLALCRAARADGTRTIVATPHVNFDYPGVTAAVIHAGIVKVNEALRAADLELTIAPGAEVALSRAAELEDGDLGVLRLGGGRYVLIECPAAGAIAGVVGALHALAARGYGIVLAHPERVRALHRAPAVLRGLVDSGMLCCVSARSLREQADPAIRAAAWGMLADGLVHVIASDAHDVQRRPPDLRATLKAVGMPAGHVYYFTDVAPAAVIGAGGPPPPPPAVEPPRDLRRSRAWRQRPSART